jgi:hypothetical protein
MNRRVVSVQTLNSNIHFIDKEMEMMGHLEDIAFSGGVIVFFPE